MLGAFIEVRLTALCIKEEEEASDVQSTAIIPFSRKLYFRGQCILDCQHLMHHIQLHARPQEHMLRLWTYDVMVTYEPWHACMVSLSCVDSLDQLSAALGRVGGCPGLRAVYRWWHSPIRIGPAMSMTLFKGATFVDVDAQSIDPHGTVTSPKPRHVFPHFWAFLCRAAAQKTLTNH
jgi:hypothetical protein